MPLRGEVLMPPLEKPRPRVLDKRDDKRDTDRIKREVYADVDERDGRRCRCCGRKGNPDALTALGKIHRAHIQDASKLGEMSAKNLCSLCWICHALEHAKQLHFIGTNANRPSLGFEIDEAAVVEVFGTRTLPKHVHIVTKGRR